MACSCHVYSVFPSKTGEKTCHKPAMNLPLGCHSAGKTNETDEGVQVPGLPAGGLLTLHEYGIPKNNKGVWGSWMMMAVCLTCEVFSSQVTDANRFQVRIRHLAGSAMVKPRVNT